MWVPWCLLTFTITTLEVSAASSRGGGCVLDGRSMEEGARVARADPCHTCRCQQGRVECVWKRCGSPPPRCRVLSARNGCASSVYLCALPGSPADASAPSQSDVLSAAALPLPPISTPLPKLLQTAPPLHQSLRAARFVTPESASEEAGDATEREASTSAPAHTYFSEFVSAPMNFTAPLGRAEEPRSLSTTKRPKSRLQFLLERRAAESERLSGGSPRSGKQGRFRFPSLRPRAVNKVMDKILERLKSRGLEKVSITSERTKSVGSRSLATKNVRTGKRRAETNTLPPTIVTKTDDKNSDSRSRNNSANHDLDRLQTVGGRKPIRLRSRAEHPARFVSKAPTRPTEKTKRLSTRRDQRPSRKSKKTNAVTTSRTTPRPAARFTRRTTARPASRKSKPSGQGAARLNVASLSLFSTIQPPVGTEQQTDREIDANNIKPAAAFVFPNVAPQLLKSSGSQRTAVRLQEPGATELETSLPKASSQRRTSPRRNRKRPVRPTTRSSARERPVTAPRILPQTTTASPVFSEPLMRPPPRVIFITTPGPPMRRPPARASPIPAPRSATPPRSPLHPEPTSLPQPAGSSSLQEQFSSIFPEFKALQAAKSSENEDKSSSTVRAPPRAAPIVSFDYDLDEDIDLTQFAFPEFGKRLKRGAEGRFSAGAFNLEKGFEGERETINNAFGKNGQSRHIRSLLPGDDRSGHEHHHRHQTDDDISHQDAANEVDYDLMLESAEEDERLKAASESTPCTVFGQNYGQGEVIGSVSDSCLECRCARDAMLCYPKCCFFSTEEP